MTEQEERMMNEIRESVVIVYGLRELILRLESEMIDRDEELYQITIDYIRSILAKHSRIAKTPVTKDKDGRIVPLLIKN